jgi:cathepsin X
MSRFLLFPLAASLVSATSLPDTFSWAEVNGTNYLTRILNQHIPEYCGSCWAHAAMSCLADRVKIQSKGRSDAVPAIQVILNCANAGTCDTTDTDEWRAGLNLAGVNSYKYVSAFGVPDDSCQSYRANVQSCDPVNVCQTCSATCDTGSKPQHCHGPGTCKAVASYPKFGATAYGQVKGVDGMMAQVASAGPIACTLVSEPLDIYTGGIIRKAPGKQSTHIDHVVSIVGWGQTEEAPYWLVRNSWGSAWGESGFFRIERGSNAFMIESNCSWVTPTALR